MKFDVPVFCFNLNYIVQLKGERIRAIITQDNSVPYNDLIGIESTGKFQYDLSVLWCYFYIFLYCAIDT